MPAVRTGEYHRYGGHGVDQPSTFSSSTKQSQIISFLLIFVMVILLLVLTCRCCWYRATGSHPSLRIDNQRRVSKLELPMSESLPYGPIVSKSLLGSDFHDPSDASVADLDLFSTEPNSPANQSKKLSSHATFPPPPGMIRHDRLHKSNGFRRHIMVIT